MKLQLEQGKTTSKISLNGQVLKTFNGYFDLEDHDHELIEKLYQSFAGIKEEDIENGSVTNTNFEENKIFELYKRLTEGKEEIIKDNFPHFIQWTPLFRSTPDQRIKMETYDYFSSLFDWLETHNLEMEDLPLNYCQSGEEFDETVKEYEESGGTFKVSDPLVNALVQEALAMSSKKQAGLLFLYFTFDEPVFPLLFLTGACAAKEMGKGILAAFSEIPGWGIDEDEFEKISRNIMQLGERVLAFVS